MKRTLTLLIFSLMLASTSVSAQQDNYRLTVPVYKSVPASLTRMREVLTTLNATFETDASLDYVDAILESPEPHTRHVSVMQSSTSMDMTTGQPTLLDVACVDTAGGAEALCREIQRRYKDR